MASLRERGIRIVGVPIDLGASRRGTDMGPSALRVAGVGAALRRLGYEVRREADVAVPSMESRQSPDREGRAHYLDEIVSVCDELDDVVRGILAEGDTPLVFGGDHSIAMGTVTGVASHFRAREERAGLVWFDAHADMNTPASSPSGNVHGMPLSHLLGLDGTEPALAELGGFRGKVAPGNVALIGIRDVDRGESEIVRDSGVHCWTMREIDERGMSRVAREALEVVSDGTAGFHLSFDVDGLDPEVVAGVGTPVPGGVNYREAHLMLELFAEHGGMTSMEVVELNPLLDARNRGAVNMRHLIASAFGLTVF